MCYSERRFVIYDCLVMNITVYTVHSRKRYNKNKNIYKKKKKNCILFILELFIVFSYFYFVPIFIFLTTIDKHDTKYCLPRQNDAYYTLYHLSVCTDQELLYCEFVDLCSPSTLMNKNLFRKYITDKGLSEGLVDSTFR